MIVASRNLAKAGWVYYLYWFHDFIYLPVKAYGYRYFFPFSTIWLGLFSGAAMTWLFFFLAHRSFWRKPHGDLLGWVLRKPAFFALVRGTADWQRRRGFFPGMLVAAAGRERRILLWYWFHHHSGPEGNRLSAQLGHLTLLECDLRRPSETNMADTLAALCCWQEVFSLLVRHYIDLSPPPWLVSLAERLYPMVKKVLPVDDEVRFQPVLEKEADYSLETLFIDLLFLAAIYDRAAAVRVLGAEAAVWPVRRKIRLISKRLYRSSEDRRKGLNGVRLRLESRFYDARVSDPSELFFSLPRVAEESLCHMGNLALGLALDLALLTDLPETGIVSIEAVEALKLAFDMAGPNTQNDESWFRLAALIAHQPRPRDFLVCALLEERRQSRRVREWERSPLSQEGSLDRGDFAFSRTSATALFQSAQLEVNPLCRPPGD